MKEFIEKFKEIKTIIEENQNIILTAHVNPDGDAVGSGLGLFLTLKENYKDKNIRFVLQDSIPYTTKFLKGSEEIEKYNIYNAARIAMQRAVEKLDVKPDFLLIDAMPFENYPIPSYSMVKGDEKSVSIAAASVIAKVYRDNLMKKYASKYPYYDFENNAGYGTKKHLEGLRKHGITPIHRRDFEPIKSMIKRGGNNGQ